MIYDKFNPSPLEIEVAGALESLRGPLQQQLNGKAITKTEILQRPNHHVELVLTLNDSDGDEHIITLRMIHTPVEDLAAQGYL